MHMGELVEGDFTHKSENTQPKKQSPKQKVCVSIPSLFTPMPSPAEFGLCLHLHGGFHCASIQHRKKKEEENICAVRLHIGASVPRSSLGLHQTALCPLLASVALSAAAMGPELNHIIFIIPNLHAHSLRV